MTEEDILKQQQQAQIQRQSNLKNIAAVKRNNYNQQEALVGGIGSPSSTDTVLWGHILGEISNQFDLMVRLDEKQNLLPTPIPGMFLHVNASTSALEWLSVSGGAGGPATWGNIIGNLSSQTDLHNALTSLGDADQFLFNLLSSGFSLVSSDLSDLSLAISTETVRSTSVDNEISDVISSVILPQLSNKIDSIFLLSNHINSLDAVFTEANFTSASNGKTAVAYGADLLSSVFPDTEGHFVLRQASSEDDRELQFVHVKANKSDKTIKKIGGVWQDWRNIGLEVSVNNVKQSEDYSFYAPLSSGLSGQILVSDGEGKSPYWVDMAEDTMYQHSIKCFDYKSATSSITASIEFSFINSVSTEYADCSAVSQALYNLGYDSPSAVVVANGYSHLTSTSVGRGYYQNVYGVDGGISSFRFYKAFDPASFGGTLKDPGYYGESWQYTTDHVTLVSKSKFAVNSRVCSSGLSFDDIYPTGSIYFNIGETLPPVFTAAGRTWEKISNGTFLMAADGTTTVAGSTGGTNSMRLMTANLPSHSHSVAGTTSSSGAHTHGVGTYQIAGGFTALYEYATGPFSAEQWGSVGTGTSTANHYGKVNFNANSGTGFTGSSASAGAHTHTMTGEAGDTGLDQPFDNRPLYLAVSMWKRTS